MDSSEALEKIISILSCGDVGELTKLQLGQGNWDSFTHVEIVDIVETTLNRELTEFEFGQTETGAGLVFLVGST